MVRKGKIPTLAKRARWGGAPGERSLSPRSEGGEKDAKKVLKRRWRGGFAEGAEKAGPSLCSG